MANAFRQTRGAARILLAHRLQKQHGIAAEDMARILAISLEKYLAEIERLGPDEAEPKAQPTQSPTAMVLDRLQSELKRLIEGEELPDKGKAEALTALARAVKTVGELVSEAGQLSPPERENKTESAANIRQVLSRIDRRIDELANKRAQAMLGGGFDAKTTNGGGGRMADPGA